MNIIFKKTPPKTNEHKHNRNSNGKLYTIQTQIYNTSTQDANISITTTRQQEHQQTQQHTQKNNHKPNNENIFFYKITKKHT